jgi:hypothetical protein
MEEPPMANRKPNPNDGGYDPCVLDDIQQRKLLGLPEKLVRNVGWVVPEKLITESPFEVVYPEPGRAKGINKSYARPASGISNADNLDDWSKRASANSYRGLTHKPVTDETNER